ELRVGEEKLASSLTTPEAPDLQALFAVMAERGVTAAAMEVSSHSLALGRVAGTAFDVAVFTNLSRDHLDFHADMEDYFRAKASLFMPPVIGVVNIDDRYGRRLAAEAAACPGVPGRLERVPAAGLGVTAFVDYSHKPGAVEAVLRSLRPVTQGNLIIVLGCGGDRDKAKRPMMGAAAAALADVAILTSDNPRSEDPLAIL